MSSAILALEIRDTVNRVQVPLCTEANCLCYVSMVPCSLHTQIAMQKKSTQGRNGTHTQAAGRLEQCVQLEKNRVAAEEKRHL